jgi:predicted RNA methylase
MKVAQDVMAILDGSRTDGNALFLSGQLDRKLYTSTAKVIEAAGGKWNRKAGAHLFDGDASEAVEPILLTGVVTVAKQEFGAFYTPEKVAQRVANLAGIKAGDRVLEPSAGSGALAKWARFLGGDVTCVELQEVTCRGLALGGFNPVCADFLALPVTAFSPFDVVLMNPPFAGQADVAHVTHALKFLRPGGRLVAIMSASVRFRENATTAAFREMVSRCGGDITDLPPGSFAASGTNVNTVIVTMERAA